MRVIFFFSKHFTRGPQQKNKKILSLLPINLENFVSQNLTVWMVHWVSVCTWDQTAPSTLCKVSLCLVGLVFTFGHRWDWPRSIRVLKLKTAKELFELGVRCLNSKSLVTEIQNQLIHETEKKTPPCWKNQLLYIQNHEISFSKICS